MKKLTHTEDYREVRKALYPEVGDQLDAIWKLLATLSTAAKDDPVYKQIQEVKRRVPKP